VTVAVMFFERAYGLNGQKRLDHDTLKKEMMALTGCSERAVHAVLYGSSYSDLLGSLRAQIPGYMGLKGSDSQDFTALPFYNFDGNLHAVASRHEVFSLDPVTSPAPEIRASASPPPESSTVESSPSFSETLSTSPSSDSSTLSSLTVDENVSKHYPTLFLLALVAILPLTLLY